MNQKYTHLFCLSKDMFQEKLSLFPQKVSLQTVQVTLGEMHIYAVHTPHNMEHLLLIIIIIIIINSLFIEDYTVSL